MCDGHNVHSEESEEQALTRRKLLANSAILAAIGAAGPTLAELSLTTPAAVGAAGRTQVYLLGSQGGQQRTVLTGAQIRSGTAALILVDGVAYMIDAGVGALLRLNEAGFDATAIRHIFMTHHHQDHNADLGNMIGFGWTSGRQGDPRRRLDVWGPPGTNAYVRGYKISTALNIRDQEGPLAQAPSLDDYAHAHEFPIEGRIRKFGVKVMSDSRVSVRAIRVNHGDLPTVGYRFKTPDLDIAFSGDRGDRGDHFPRFAAGVGVLFHEIIDIDLVLPILEEEQAPASFISHQLHDHAAPKQAGGTATSAAAPKLVLYHLIPGNPVVTDSAWQAMVAPYYAGEIVVGKDLMEV